ncbi:hypothetical protein A4S06_07835 [Erysipelotrichaceae bacterium MTC7]|nr:hypothetical protein A4S06_07835 [Erysipelotrichaceae bacterium MTC7]
MKYPILEIAQVPRGFKSSEAAYLVNFVFEGKENFATDELRESYINFIEREVHGLIESLHILYRPEIVQLDGQYFVLLKDNMDEYQVRDTIKKILGEVNQYTEGKVKVTAHLLMGLLLEQGKVISVFKSRKMGDPIFTSTEYANSVVEGMKPFDPKELSFVTPWQEFVMLHSKKTN